MSQDKRDPGLQPERTAMSWFRTHLLILVNGLLLFKVGDNQGYWALQLLGAAMLLFALVGVHYSGRRFVQLFNDQMAVSGYEVQIKKILSSIIVIAAASYLVYCLSKLL